MAVTKKEGDFMRRLAREGKPISRIAEEDFPGLEYWEVYVEVYGAGERSARGIKKMISLRLNQVVSAPKAERQTIVEELTGLIWHLYENHKHNAEKLQSIRKALDA